MGTVGQRSTTISLGLTVDRCAISARGLICTNRVASLLLLLIALAVAAPAKADEPELNTLSVAFVKISDALGKTTKVTGSGILLTKDGWILTAAHLFEGIDEGSDRIEVSFHTKNHPVPARYFGCDPFAADFCLLYVDVGDLPVSGDALVQLHLPEPGCQIPSAGQNVTMYGFKSTIDSVSVAAGPVSNSGLDHYFKVETDASGGQPGMSGGPVIYKGKIVGIIYAGITPANGNTILAYTPIKFARVVLQAAGVDCVQ